MNLWKQQKPSFCILIRKVSDMAETMAALKSSTHNLLKWLPDVCVSSLTSSIIYQVQSVLHSCFLHHQKSFQLTENLETHIHALLTLHYFLYSCLQECNTTKAIESPLSILQSPQWFMGSFLLFQHPLFLDFFSKMLYKYSYSKTFYNTFPIQSGFVCCKLQYQRAFAGWDQESNKKDLGK